MAQSPLEELVSMGYTEAQASQALKVADGDLEQAVGFLCLGESSQVGFNKNVEDADYFDQKPAARPTKSAPTAAAATPILSASEAKAVKDLVAMGYEEHRAQQALKVTHGDMDQAVSFLAMGESRMNFVTEDPDDQKISSKNNHINDNMNNNNDADVDAALAAILQQEEIDQRAAQYQNDPAGGQADNLKQPPPPHHTKPGSESEMYHTTAMNQQKDAPKMVATESKLVTPGAAPYCACVAAARFLTGGVVTSAFLNSILGGGVELYRKNDDEENGSPNITVSEVLNKYGKTHLGIVSTEGLSKTGYYIDHDLKHEMGVRRLLTDARNEQRDGWAVLIMELELDSFLICLPPKGSKNKFWYIDFSPRAQFRVPGAYARVHSTLLQMQESIESIFHTLIKSRGLDIESFTLYHITRIGGDK